MGSLMDDYIDYTGGAGFHDVGAPLVDQHPHHPHQYMPPPMGHLPDGTGAVLYNAMPQPGSCDVKPRLNKLQHDFLEAEYKKQNKPNTLTKKEFAQKLNVTLDKVNNWFQNRRAKTKQDLKKARSSLNLYNSNVNSDTEPSPFQPSGDYAAMMQQLSGDGQPSNGLGLATGSHSQVPEQLTVNEYNGNNAGLMSQPNDFNWQMQIPQQYYDPNLDINRRTLTQEAFDAMPRDGGMVNGQGEFEGLDRDFAGDQDIMAQIFGSHVGQPKGQELTFPFPVGAPMSSHDSTLPSSSSDQSYQFPSTDSMQNHASSISGSEWADSRSSSLSMLHPVSSIPELSASQPQMPSNNSQWQPGQSVPVDLNQHYEEFRQAAQGRASEVQVNEQPVSYPSEAFTRRSSQASALAQSMGNVNIHTPQPEQAGVFKSPAPPVAGGIAARRQRPRPANLGVAALRSASYSGAAQPGSPSHGNQPANLTQDQQLRRIRSAVAMNGGVAHGRIMKSTPGSAQRSPVNWSFSHGVVSPHLARHMSHGNLAPPTPLSPREYAHSEQTLQASSMQLPNQMMHNASISESDFENSFGGLPYQPSASVPPHQNFSSPPHTPMYHEYPMLAQRMGSHVITENTPPQSAPAAQTCFPSNLFGPPAPPQPHQQSHHHSQSVHGQPQGQNFMHTPQPLPVAAVEQPPPPIPTVTFAPSQQSNVTTGPPPGVPLQFANGIPTVTAEGIVKMSFPPQAQLIQQQSSQMGTPPQQQYAFVTQSGGSPGGSSIAGATPQQRGELFVHEYSPPDAVKRAATPRKAVEAAAPPPKSYTFANHGPVDYEKRAKKSADGRESSTSCSPASSSCTNGSS